MWAIGERYIKKNRFQWREKRDYVDSYDVAAITRVVNSDATSGYNSNRANSGELLRSIKTATADECHKVHDMFIKFADTHNETVEDYHGAKTENKIFIRGSYSHHPKTSSCIISAYPMSLEQEETHQFYDTRNLTHNNQ